MTRNMHDRRFARCRRAAAPLRAEQPAGIDAALQTVAGSAKGSALEAIKADDAAAFAEQKRITEIAAPPTRRRFARNTT